jgi:hypothetical protein
MHAKALQKPKSETKSRRIDAEELRAKQKAKEDAKTAKKIATANRKAEIDARRTQAALDRSERLATKKFKDEYLRLAKIHITYYINRCAHVEYLPTKMGLHRSHK